MNYQKKISELGILLPACPKPAGSYQPVIIQGKMAYISGQIARTREGKILTGRLGTDLDLKRGQEAARSACLNLLAAIQDQIGFDRFDRFLRLTAYVQTAQDFHDIPQVINAASDLLVSVFGEFGIHARSAVGAASLPLNSAVELEATVSLK